LVTALRSVQRQNTDAEITAQLRRQGAHALARKLVEQDIDHEAKLREQAHQHAQLALKTVGSKRVEALDDDEHPLHDQMVKEAEAGLQRGAGHARLTAESATKLIEPPKIDGGAPLSWPTGNELPPPPKSGEQRSG
jgi:hypothetical protein